MPVLRIRLLGGQDLAWNETAISQIPGAIHRSLFAYLVISPRVHTRDLLAGTFWPDLSESTAHRRLSHALWLIRKTLSPHPVLFAESGTIQFNPDFPIWLDVREFESHIAQYAHNPSLDLLQHALDVYRGDFMAGYYDDWLLIERERLRGVYLNALEKLIQEHKRRGDPRGALTCAQCLVAEEPWREEAHREVMRLLHLLGRTAEAQKQFEACRRVLKDEFDASPQPETVALAQELEHHSDLEAAPYLPQKTEPVGLLSAPLVGRQEERANLLSHLEAAIHGFGGVVLVAGESGVGKTRLLQELTRDAEWRDVRVLWGHSRESGGVVPFAPWVEALQSDLSPLRVEQWSQIIEPIWLQVLRPLLPALAAVTSGLAPALEPERERERLINAFVQLLGGWGRLIPLVLILEDLHWTDEDSLEVLIALGRRLSEHKVLIVGSYRTDEALNRPAVWERLQTLHHSGHAEWLRLNPLDAAGCSALIRRSLGTDQAAPLFETRLYQETGGNPLFILEILRSLYDEELLSRDAAGRWSTPWDEMTVTYAELPLPPGVEQAIVRRLVHLSPEERAVLEMSAVLGDSFDFRLLQAICNYTPDRLLPVVNILLHRHFLVEQPTTYEFSHNHIRQVVYRALPPDARRVAHSQAAAALHALHPEQAAALAHHFAQSEQWGQAVEAYFAVGRAAAAVYATETALHAYEQALDLLQTRQPFTVDRAARLHFDLLVARCSLQRLRGARKAHRVDVDTLLTLAQTLGDPVRQVAALLQQAQFLSESASEYEVARQVAEEALALAQQHALRPDEVRAWLVIGTAWKQQGHTQPALEAYQHALTVQQTLSETTDGEVDIYIWLIMTYRDMGDLERAQETAQIALSKAQARSNPLAVARVHNALAWITRARGDHRAEAEHCQAMLAQMQAIGHRYYEGVACNNLSLAHSALGEYGPAIEAAQQAQDIFHQIDHRHGQVIVLLNLSSRYKETGQLAQARHVLTQSLPLARELSLADDEARILSSLAELLIQDGDFDAANQTLLRAEEIARDLDSAYLQAMVHCRAGALCLATGDYDQAAVLFDRAVQEYATSGYADYQTYARSFLASALHRQGNLKAAVALSSQAVAEMEALPESPLILETCLYHYQIMTAAGRSAAALPVLERAYVRVQEQCAALPDPAWRRGFVEDVILHRRIVDAWETSQPRRIDVRLPHVEAPLGRPLRADEYITVTWTLSLPEDKAVQDEVARRRARLQRLLQEAIAQGAAATVEDLAVALDVSSRTIKRDLAAFRAAGHAFQTRGSQSQ